MKLLHTMIRVADINKSLEFYQDVMGLKSKGTMELEKATLYFLTDNDGNYEIELTYNHIPPENDYTQGTYFGHLAFGTDNMDKFSEILKSKGLNYKREPFMIAPKGPQIAFIEDPDGYEVEIIERK